MTTQGEDRETNQATLSIDFLIVGGGISGLACAIALQRVGHRVLVLEKSLDIRQDYGPCRLPPNLSKILHRWGLAEEVASISLKSSAITIYLQESGELLGNHIWSEELLREAQGDYLLCHLNDLRELLYRKAISLGAEVRLGAEVTAVDSSARSVSLASGEVLSGDAIIGADGADGLCRQMLLEDEGLVDRNDLDPEMCLYSAIIPTASMTPDDQLRDLYEREHTSVYTWCGSKHAVVAFPLGGTPDFGLLVYGQKDGNEKDWEHQAPIEGLRSSLEPCEPRLRNLANLITSPPICVPIELRPPLENWVDNRLVLIGSAAHPLPAGSIQDTAMAVEDGAVLAKLFSHLRSEDQIESFLFAFQDLRQPRCQFVCNNEVGNLKFMTLEPSESQQYRDYALRAKRDAGMNVLDAVGDIEATSEWEEIKTVFGYDAEDEADNWWMAWGLLRERARGNSDAAPVVKSTKVVEVSDALGLPV